MPFTKSGANAEKFWVTRPGTSPTVAGEPADYTDLETIATNLVSADVGNGLTVGGDSGLFVAAGGGSVSTDTPLNLPNGITTGSDSGLLVNQRLVAAVNHFDTAANARLASLTSVSQISVSGIHYNAIATGPADSGGLSPQYLVAADGATFEREYIQAIDAREFGLAFDWDPDTFTGTDDSAAYIAMVNEVLASSDNIGIVFPAGNTFISTGATISRGADTLLRMRGQGRATRIYQDVANGAVGFLDLTCTHVPSRMEVILSDFLITAFSSTLGAGVLPTASAQIEKLGTAIKLERNAVPGLRAAPEAHLSRIYCESHLNWQAQYDRDIDIIGLRYPRLIDNFCKNMLNWTVDKHRDTWPAYQKSASLRIQQCWSARVLGGEYRGGAEAAIQVVTNGAEGGYFEDVVATDGKYGVSLDGTSGEPGFTWKGGHFNYRDGGALIRRGRVGTIEGCLFYNENDTASNGGAQGVTEPTDITFGPDVDIDWTVKDNWMFFLDSPYNSARIHIDDQRTSASEIQIGDVFVNDGGEYAAFYRSAVTQKVWFDGQAGYGNCTTPWLNGGTASGVQYQQVEGNNTKYFGYGNPNTAGLTGVDLDQYIDIDGSSGYSLWKNQSGLTWLFQYNHAIRGRTRAQSGNSIEIPFDHGGYLLVNSTGADLTSFTYPAGWAPEQGDSVTLFVRSATSLVIKSGTNIDVPYPIYLGAGDQLRFVYNSTFDNWFPDLGGSDHLRGNPGQTITVSANGALAIPEDHGGYLRVSANASGSFTINDFTTTHTPLAGERVSILMASNGTISYSTANNLSVGAGAADVSTSTGDVRTFVYDAAFTAWFMENKDAGAGGGGIALTDLPRPWNVRIITSADSPVTAAHGDILSCDSSGGVISITLPAATGPNAQFVEINTGGSADTNNIIINTTGADTILGQASITNNLNGHTYTYRAHSAGAYN